MEWITSDSHLCHKNIIKGFSDWGFREFKSCGDMNDTIINNWNKVVGEFDTVYHLGDFSLTGKSLRKKLRERLKGIIILILGNHDKGKQHMTECGFDDVHDFLVLGKDRLILSHRPLFSDLPTLNVSVENWNYYPIPLPKSKQWIQICGHSHNNYLIGGIE